MIQDQQLEMIPKESLYIQNLNDKIQPEELKTNLYFLFSQYGEILEIVCRKGLRGQAFVIFKLISSATHALRQLQGFNFCGKDLKISFSKEKSDLTLKQEGKFEQKLQKKRQKQKTVQGPTLLQEKKVKAEVEAPQKIVEQNEETQASNILFLENLPVQMTSEMITVLFKQYPGFIEARLIQQKQIAFVEYSNEDQAELAMQGLQGFKITNQNFMKVSFAKT